MMTELFQSRATSEKTTLSFGETFVASDSFRALFREGMGLVETTAAYLDGDGRQQAKDLSRNVALAYASESMRLTTRLMQVASWLLLQRAVAEGELSLHEARNQKNRVRVSEQDMVTSADVFCALPLDLRDLVSHSLRLQARIIHLDQLIDARTISQAPPVNAVALQHQLLASAFGAEGR
jgi:regulator of CtrA degradation